MDFLSALPIGQLSAGALLAIVVLAILRGKLVPRQQLLDTQADRDKWREIADKQLSALIQIGISSEKLLAGVELMNHTVGDLQRLADHEDPR